MPATVIPARTAVLTRWMRFRLGLRLETLLAVVLGLLLAVIASWAFAESIHALTVIALLLLLVLVFAPISLGWAARRGAIRRFAATEGPTTVRWARRSDREALRSSIDHVVLDAFGWSETDRDEFCESVISGPMSGVEVVVEPGGKLIGAARIIPVSATPVIGRLVAWVHPARRGLGHGTRAVGLVMQNFTAPTVTVIAEAAQDDVAAQKIAESAGFVRMADVGDRANFIRSAVEEIDATPAPPAGASPRSIGWVLLVLMLGVMGWAGYETGTNHFGAVTILGPQGTIECGSLASPVRQASDVDEWNCETARSANEPGRFRGVALLVITAFGALMGLILVFAQRIRPKMVREVMTPKSVGFDEVGGLLRSVEPLVDDSTAVRSVRPGDAAEVVASIDDHVIDVMGWTAEIRSAYGSSVGLDLAPGLAAVTVRGEDRLVGAVGLEPIADTGGGAPHREVRVGAWMAAEARHAGHMTRAVRMLAAMLRENGIAAVAETSVDNAIARRMFVSAGFVEGGRRSVTLPNGTIVEAVVFEFRPGA